jgi:hypothetical protein
MPAASTSSAIALGLRHRRRGDPQAAFEAPGAGANDRLGSEAEAHLETTFAYGQRTKGDPSAP